MNFLSAALGFLAGLFKWGSTVQEEKNSPEMQANKTAEQDSKEADKIAKLIVRANAGDKGAQAELWRLNAED